MKIISILKDFGIYDIGDEEEVLTILDKIDIGEYSHIKLDLAGCIPDYPGTSKLIDRVISQLKKLSGKKTINIELDYLLPIETITTWLFLGSKELNITDDNEKSFKKIKKTIEKNIKNLGITLCISIKKHDGACVDELTFK